MKSQVSHVSQAAHALMMVRPVRFCYNQETAVDNAFMNEIKSSPEATQAKALQEFDTYVSTLKAKGIEVTCFEDTPLPHTPDSIFPNNWISFHEDGTIVLYPMKAENRRAERRLDIIEDLEKKYNYKVERRIDISDLEKEEKFLEGTGSIIFDYINRIAYACVSQRTNKEVLEQISERIGFKAYPFHSVDENGKEIYHTNVMMCLGERYVMICTQSIPDEGEREALMKSFRDTGHEIVDLTHEQLRHFAGNALEVRNQEGKTFLIISEAGYKILTEEQKEVIRQYDEIVPIPLHIIETNGGGSARCMISDIRLPKRS